MPNLADEILSTDITDAQSRALETFLNRGNFGYTTTVLRALAKFHAETGDERSAEALRRFAEEFAHIEATVV